MGVGHQYLGRRDVPPRAAQRELFETLTGYFGAVATRGMPAGARVHNEAKPAPGPVQEAARAAANCVLEVVAENYQAFEGALDLDKMDDYLEVVLREFYTSWLSPRHNPKKGKKGKQGSLFTTEEEGFALVSPEGKPYERARPSEGGSQPTLFELGKPDRKKMEEMRERELAERAARKKRKKMNPSTIKRRLLKR